MGVFYDVRVHLAENADDFIGKKGTTVGMGIRKVGKETILRGNHLAFNLWHWHWLMNQLKLHHPKFVS